MTRKFVSPLPTLLALVWLAALASQAQQLPSRMSPEYESWHAAMKQIPVPSNGCFKASYPVAVWQDVPCTTAPNRPYLPARGAKSGTVGNGHDFTGVVSGLLSQAEGSFLTGTSVGSSDAYSIQLNANTFSTSAFKCGGGDCVGWQQFVYSSSPSELFMQYWLLDYGNSCPSGWTEYQGSCYKNSSATTITAVPIADAPYTSLTGKAAGGTDTALMDSLYGDISAVGADSVLNLEQGWNHAEFNIFGNGNGSEVVLDANEALAVQISLTNGTTNKPTYTTAGFTGETNNLNLVGTAPCLYGGTTPMIQFMESNTSSATASCGASAITTNIAQPPRDTVISVGNCHGGCTFIPYELNLIDSTPGARIYMLIYECQSESLYSNVPLGNFGFDDYYPGCQPWGTMYATAPGYLTSSTNYMTF